MSSQFFQSKWKVATIFVLVVLIAAFFSFEKYAVMKCTKATAATLKEKSISVQDGRRVYDIYYAVCMGKFGFER